MKFILKIGLTIVYVIGIICVAAFSFIYLQKSTYIPNPESMLPMMEYEMAVWKLIVGLPVMIASCVSILLVYRIRKVLKGIAVFTPAIVCFIMVVSYFMIDC